MSDRYAAYRLHQRFWLQDHWCDYYALGIHWCHCDILNVPYMRFFRESEAEQWLAQCMAFEPCDTISSLRRYLSYDAQDGYLVHRMDDARVVRAVARELQMLGLKVVVRPRFGMAVEITNDFFSPKFPLAFADQPDIDMLLGTLQRRLDTLVRGQERQFHSLRSLSDLARHATVRAVPAELTRAVQAFPGFHSGLVPGLSAIGQAPARVDAILQHMLLHGHPGPIAEQIATVAQAVHSDREADLACRAMLTTLLTDAETAPLFLDFARRYLAVTYTLEREWMGISSPADLITALALVLALLTDQRAEPLAATMPHLREAVDHCRQLAEALKTSPPRHPPARRDRHPETAAAEASSAPQRTPPPDPFKAPATAPPATGAAAVLPGNAGREQDAASDALIPVCAFAAFTMQCGHFGKNIGQRSYVLDVLNGAPTLDHQKVLQVISNKDQPDIITLDFAGHCVNGNDNCPALEILGDGPSRLVRRSPYKFKAPYKTEAREINGFIDFVKRYLAPDLDVLDPYRYGIRGLGCAGMPACAARVDAFPNFQWGGELSFGYGYPGGGRAKTMANVDRRPELLLEGAIKGKVGKKTWHFQTGNIAQSEGYFPKLKPFMQDFVQAIEKLSNPVSDPKGRKAQVARLDITWPKFSLGGHMALLEAEAAHNVDLGGELHLKFDPLLKADLRIDVLHMLIQLAKAKTGGVAAFLEMVRDAAEKGIDSKTLSAKAVVRLDLIIQGSLEADLKWQKDANQKWIRTRGDKTGQVSMGLTIGLEAAIRAEAKVFYVKMTVGANLQIKGARNASEGVGGIITLFATTAAGKPAVGGDIIFTGAAIYYMFYAEVSKDENVTDEGGRKGQANRTSQDKGVSTKLQERELTKFHEFMKASSWPRRLKETLYLNGEVGDETVAISKLEL